MIVLDTNVLSELMRPTPNVAVVRWIDHQPSSALHVTSITIAEILFGIELLPGGRRREQFACQAGEMIDTDFAGRILDFTADSALHYARIAAGRRRAGNPISQADAQIAAICIAHEFKLASRDTGGFVNFPLPVINPWKE